MSGMAECTPRRLLHMGKGDRLRHGAATLRRPRWTRNQAQSVRPNAPARPNPHPTQNPPVYGTSRTRSS